MKLVYTSDDFMMAGQILGLLESNQISCFMKNASLTGGLGELPINECWPEVWVHQDKDERLATKLIHSFIKNDTSQTAWECECGEKIEGQFTECWSCGYVFN